MRLLDALAWIALFLLGCGAHESLALPTWLMPLFGVPSFAYFAWRDEVGGDWWAELVVFLVVGGAIFVVVDRLPEGWLEEWIVVAAPVVALVAGWTADRVRAVLAAGRTSPAAGRPAGGQEA
jgi:hypothetical protein